MTTKITIKHGGPGHHNVRVIERSWSPTPAAESVLGPGQSVSCLVYDGRRVDVSETLLDPTHELAPVDPRTAGQVAFEAYNVSKGGLTYDGKPIPPWDSLTNDAGIAVRAAWEAAAAAVLAR